MAWAAGAALAGPPIALALGLDPLVVTRALGAWTAGHGAVSTQGLILTAYAGVQLAVFVAALALVSLPAAKRRLTPRSLKQHRVRQAALGQLAAAALAAGPDRAAVVIFASEDDRIVQVLATPAIHEKVGPAIWDRAVAAVLEGMKSATPADGFVRAVGLCGAALAENFPQTTLDRNASPDGLLEL